MIQHLKHVHALNTESKGNMIINGVQTTYSGSRVTKQ